jgi:hypothetical protein
MPVTNTTIRFDFQVGTPPTNDPIYLFRNGAFENGAVPRGGNNSPTEIVGNWLVVKPNASNVTEFRLDFLSGVDLTNYTRLNVTWVTERGYNAAGTALANGPNVTLYTGGAGNNGLGSLWSAQSLIPNTSWTLASGHRVANVSSLELWRDAGMLGELYITEISFSTNDVPTPPTLPPAVLQSIAVTTPPALLLFQVGEKFSSTGLLVNASYVGKRTTDVTADVVLTMGAKTINNDYEFLAEDEGSQTITVSNTEGGVTRTATFNITVTAGDLVVESIAVTTRPTKWVYEVGETFVRTGLVVTATYVGGATSGNRANYATLTIGGTDLTGYSFLAADIGIQTITVTYEGQTTSFDLRIFEKPDNPWYLAAVRNGGPASAASANMIYNPGNAINDAGTFRLYIYFPALGQPVEHFSIEFETTGNITIERQGIINATNGMGGWGNGVIASGANIPLTGAGDWGWGDASANTGQMVGLCVNIRGAGATGEWTFRLTGVTLTGAGGGNGGDDPVAIDLATNFPDTAAGVINGGVASVTGTGEEVEIRLQNWGPFNASAYTGIRFEYKATHGGNFMMDSGGGQAYSKDWDSITVAADWQEYTLLFSEAIALWGDGPFNPATIYVMAFEIYGDDGVPKTIEVRNLFGLK